ncbi:hypothetical protein T484DRAFT_1841650, partial [Baffinella frigidus]
MRQRKRILEKDLQDAKAQVSLEDERIAKLAEHLEEELREKDVARVTATEGLEELLKKERIRWEAEGTVKDASVAEKDEAIRVLHARVAEVESGAEKAKKA